MLNDALKFNKMNDFEADKISEDEEEDLKLRDPNCCKFCQQLKKSYHPERYRRCCLRFKKIVHKMIFRL